MTNNNQKRCSYLCEQHLNPCDLDTNQHGGLHDGICRCEKCPTRVKIKSKDCDHTDIDITTNCCKSCNDQFAVCKSFRVEGSMRDVLHEAPVCKTDDTVLSTSKQELLRMLEEEGGSLCSGTNYRRMVDSLSVVDVEELLLKWKSSDIQKDQSPGSIQFSTNALDPTNEILNEVFEAKDIKKASSNTLPPCVECKSPDTIAVRRIDIIYAVTACIVCNHRRQMTESEYLEEWPERS